MHLSVKSRSLFLFTALALAGLEFARAQSLNVVSGNGQTVPEQFLTLAPLVVQAKDATGKPVAGVAIDWSVRPIIGGTVVRPDLVTDADGFARAMFLGSGLQPLTSFLGSTVTASSALGSANFFVTTFLYSGANAVQPLVELVAPTFENRNNLTGAVGSTLPGAVVVRVSAASGISAGQPIPNVGVRLALPDGTGSTGPAVCAGPNGVVLTDARGLATCDVTITGPPGSTRLLALVGELLGTPTFSLQVTPGSACSFSISPTSKAFGSSGGTGSVAVTTTSGCASTAFSGANWVTITSGSNLAGSGTVNYSVGPNTGAARTALLVIAGRTFVVNQDAGSTGGPAPLSISTQSLPVGTVGSSYSGTVSATGGTPPYTFAVSGTLPNGLSFNSSTGVISGTPTAEGVYGFSVSVTDIARTSQSQNFSISVSSKGSTSFRIANVSLPNAVIGQPYNQLLQTSGGCITPFSQISRITLASGNLPAGFTLSQASDSSYSIAGTATTAGASTFTLNARSPCGENASATFTITVASTSGPPPPPPATLSASPTGLSYTLQQGGNASSQPIVVTGNGQSIAYSAAISAGANFLTIASGATGTTTGNIMVALTPAAGSLPPGAYTGAVTITPTGGGPAITVSVALTVTAPIAANLLVNPPGLAFTSPGPTGAQSFQQNLSVTSSGSVLHYGISVNSSGGWLSATPTGGDTPGIVSIIVNAAGLAVGNYSGLVAITPPTGPALNVPVTLTVSAASPAILSVTNAASFSPGAVTPGEIIVIFGSAIGPATLTPLTLDPSGAVSHQLATTQVLFDDVPAPLIYTSANQVSAIVPYEIAGRTSVRVQVQYQGLRSREVVVNVVDSNPGIFTIDTSGQGAVLNQDFSVNSAQNGAAPESVVSIFGTGEGQTNPGGTSGRITSTQLAKPVLPVSVQIDGQNADVLYAGSAPGLPAGALQVNAKIPASVRRGVAVPVVITVGNASSQAGVTLFVSPQ